MENEDGYNSELFDETSRNNFITFLSLYNEFFYIRSYEIAYVFV